MVVYVCFLHGATEDVAHQIGEPASFCPSGFTPQNAVTTPFVDLLDSRQPDDHQTVPQGLGPLGVGARPPRERPVGAPGLPAGGAAAQEAGAVPGGLRAVARRPALLQPGGRLQGLDGRLGQVRQGGRGGGAGRLRAAAGDGAERRRADDPPAGVLN